MQFGLFSNGRRPGRTLGEAWEHDLAEIVHADRLGFQEVWISEHYAPSEFMICKAAALTEQLMLGTGVRLLPYSHPFQIATEANTVDQLTGGRYLFGIGSGFWVEQFAARGIDREKAVEMFDASIDVILKLLNGHEPFDLEGPYWFGRNMALQVPSVQRPHPPITIAVSKSPDTIRTAGQNGFGVLTSDFIRVSSLKMLGDQLVNEQAAAGRSRSRKAVRACRVVYVAKDDKAARDELRDSFNSRIKWDIANAPHHQVDRVPPGGTLQDITFDYLVDTDDVIVGSPETVTGKLQKFYEESGGFGVLNLHTGRDYATPDRIYRSMTLFMTEVAPLLMHLDPDKALGTDARNVPISPTAATRQAR